MATRGNCDLSGELTAVLDWWREAGVDSAFDDAPHQWIMAQDAPGEAASLDVSALPAAAPAMHAMIGGDRGHWPAQLSAFAPWWLSEPALDEGQLRGRVPPRGVFAAPLMIMVPQPEAEDRDTLLSGPHGRLLGAMLAAMGVRDEQVYLASALPRHTPMADWPDLATRGLGDMLRAHLALARPERLITFGRHLAPLLHPPGFESPLPGNAPTQIIPVLPIINHEGRSVPVLVARDLGALLERPIAKGQFWQHWLEWSAR